MRGKTKQNKTLAIYMLTTMYKCSSTTGGAIKIITISIIMGRRLPAVMCQQNKLW